MNTNTMTTSPFEFRWPANIPAEIANCIVDTVSVMIDPSLLAKYPELAIKCRAVVQSSGVAEARANLLFIAELQITPDHELP